jgi:hypothetical protein
MLRDASELLYPKAYATVMSLDIDRDGKDALAAATVLRMARIIDETSDAKQANVFRWLMPELTKMLAELGATPAARNSMKRKDDKPKRVSQLDQLREARAKRA